MPDARLRGHDGLGCCAMNGMNAVTRSIQRFALLSLIAVVAFWHAPAWSYTPATPACNMPAPPRPAGEEEVFKVHFMNLNVIGDSTLPFNQKLCDGYVYQYLRNAFSQNEFTKDMTIYGCGSPEGTITPPEHRPDTIFVDIIFDTFPADTFKQAIDFPILTMELRMHRFAPVQHVYPDGATVYPIPVTSDQAVFAEEFDYRLKDVLDTVVRTTTFGGTLPTRQMSDAERYLSVHAIKELLQWHRNEPEKILAVYRDQLALYRQMGRPMPADRQDLYTQFLEQHHIELPTGDQQ